MKLFVILLAILATLQLSSASGFFGEDAIGKARVFVQKSTVKMNKLESDLQAKQKEAKEKKKQLLDEYNARKKEGKVAVGELMKQLKKKQAKIDAKALKAEAKIRASFESLKKSQENAFAILND